MRTPTEQDGRNLFGSQDLAVKITRARLDQIPLIVEFTKSARKAMFPMLSAASHDELAARELAGNFQAAYLDSEDGCFLTVQVSGCLIATIGFLAYDQRFPFLDIGSGPTVEVVRLYVHPSYRRSGIASLLFKALKQHASQAGIQTLYLHTHPFLLGAIEFWQRHGFRIILKEDDPVWYTTHMSLHLKA
jgi:GNAT superfamily N-acetyltransferase